MDLSLYFAEALSKRLEQLALPLMTEHQIYVEAFKVFQAVTDGTLAISRPPRKFDASVNRRFIRRLERRRDVVQDNDFAAGVWQILSAPPAGTAEEALCLIDPFAYVSFLSAMQRHGLTNRAPQALHLTTLSNPDWGKERRKLMTAEIPEAMIGSEFPLPHQVSPKRRVRRRPVEFHRTKHVRRSMRIRGTFARVSPPGSTFVDSIADPALCGGMRHVQDVWQMHSKEWLDEIIEAVNEAAQPILKVRAGYLLDVIAGIDDPRVESWVAYAQRGGSRKLNPDKGYGPTYSDKWMIATNV